MITGFVSHRCKEYDSAHWREPLEIFLKSRGIIPHYGCFLNEDCHGVLSKNIDKAIRNSHIYIAVITDSWRLAEKEGWPKREWEMWNTIHKGNSEKLVRCFGLLIDTPRANVKFIEDLVSYKVTESAALENSVSLFGQDPLLFMNQTNFDRMNNQINKFLNEIEKAEIEKKLSKKK